MENSIFNSNYNIADLLIDHTNLLGIPYTRRQFFFFFFLFKLYPVHKAINNNQAQQCFGKWKTNENSFKEKPLQYPIACIENSLEEPITIVYLQNIFTTSLSLKPQQMSGFPFPLQWLQNL